MRILRASGAFGETTDSYTRFASRAAVGTDTGIENARLRTDVLFMCHQHESY